MLTLPNRNPLHFTSIKLKILTFPAIWPLQNDEGPGGDLCCCNLWADLWLCILYTKNNGFCTTCPSCTVKHMVFVKSHFSRQKQFTFFFQNIWFSTEIHAGGLCGYSVVQIFKKPSFYLSATLVFSKGRSPQGQQPSKNLQFFNISLFGFMTF